MAFPSAVNQSGLVGIFQYANTVTDNSFGIWALIMIYVALFLWMVGRGFSPAECAVSCGFVTTMIAVFMRLMEIVSIQALYISLTALLISVAWMYFSETR